MKEFGRAAQVPPRLGGLVGLGLDLAHLRDALLGLDLRNDHFADEIEQVVHLRSADADRGLDLGLEFAIALSAPGLTRDDAFERVFVAVFEIVRLVVGLVGKLEGTVSGWLGRVLTGLDTGRHRGVGVRNGVGAPVVGRGCGYVSEVGRRRRRVLGRLRGDLLRALLRLRLPG